MNQIFGFSTLYKVEISSLDDSNQGILLPHTTGEIEITLEHRDDSGDLKQINKTKLRLSQEAFNQFCIRSFDDTISEDNMLKIQIKPGRNIPSSAKLNLYLTTSHLIHQTVQNSFSGTMG